MIKRVLIATGVVAALAGGSLVIAQTQPSPVQRGMKERRGPGGLAKWGVAGDLRLRGIELTDPQREQIRTIHQNHQAEFQQAGTKLRDAHRALSETAASDAVDESAIRSASNAVATAMADEAILRARVRAEVFNVLTPDQQQKAKDLGRRPRRQR